MVLGRPGSSGRRAAAKQQRRCGEAMMAGVPCGRQRSSEGACALEWDGDGAAQRGSSAAAAGVATGRQRRSARGRCSGGAASTALLGARVQGVKEEREERERERSQRVDFKFSQNFQLKLEKL